MLRSSLYDYSDAYLLVSGTITVPKQRKQQTQIVEKHNAPFTNSISKINNTEIDNAKEIDK